MVSYSRCITHSLMYGQDEEKGGEVIIHQGLDLTLSKQEQAVEWQALANAKNKVKLCNIIISLSDEDTEIIRNMPSDRRLQFERELLLAFIREMAARGNNINEAPFIAAHHNNTDNEHFHISVLMTTLDGKRLRDKFIGQNAQRACAKVSMEFGLQGCKKSMERERAHERNVNRKKRDEEKSKPQKPKSQVERDYEYVKRKMNRRESIQQAKKRRTMLKFMVEEVAKVSNADNFEGNLKEKGMVLNWSEKDGPCVRAFLDGKIRKYSFKALKVDMAIVPAIQPPVAAERQVTMAAEASRSIAQTPTVQHVAHTHTPAPPKAAPSVAGRTVKRMLTQQGGSRDENREYEVGDHEGYEESIRNQSRLTM